MTRRSLETLVLVIVGVVLTAAVAVAAARRAEKQESFRRDGVLLERFVRTDGHGTPSRPRFRRYADHDLACATLGAGGPVRLCLQLSRRPVHVVGGWREAALTPGRPARTDCFGLARHRGVCAPPGLSAR